MLIDFKNDLLVRSSDSTSLGSDVSEYGHGLSEEYIADVREHLYRTGF